GDAAAPLVGLGLAGQREAEAFIEAACGVEAGEGGEPDALVAALVAETDRAAEKIGAEPLALHLLADDEPSEMRPLRAAAGLVDDDRADGIAIQIGDEEKIAFGVVARQELGKLGADLGLEGQAEIPV